MVVARTFRSLSRDVEASFVSLDDFCFPAAVVILCCVIILSSLATLPSSVSSYETMTPAVGRRLALSMVMTNQQRRTVENGSNKRPCPLPVLSSPVTTHRYRKVSSKPRLLARYLLVSLFAFSERISIQQHTGADRGTGHPTNQPTRAGAPGRGVVDDR